MLGAFLGCLVGGCGSEAVPKEGRVPMGVLGHPLGTYLHVEGVRAEEGKVGTQTLLVDRVGEREVAPPIGVWVENLELPKGDRCRVSGYESGRWVGLPPDVQRVEGPWPGPQAAWRFAPFFVVTSVQAPPALAEQLHRRPDRATEDFAKERHVPMARLGHRLGKYLHVEGVRAAGSAKVGPGSPLLVDRVGDQEVAPPIEIWVVDELWRGDLDLPNGERCRLSGYESGEWIGVPDEALAAEGLPQPQAPWQFHVFFVVTSVQGPPALAERWRLRRYGR